MSVLTGSLTGMPDDLPHELHAICEAQNGVVSRSQVLEAGLTKDIIYTRLRRGSWRQLHPGVYAAFSGEPNRLAVLWAAVLYAGQGAMLSHRTAAELWGLADEPSSLVHVTIPGHRRVTKKPGIVLHLSGRASQAMHPSGLPPRTRLEETVIDLCNTARDLDTVVGWLTRAIGRRLTTQEKLRVAIEARSRVRWRSQLAELLSPDLAGIHSVLEFRYLRDVERPHRFPAATRQAQSRHNGRNQYRDTLYEPYKTAVELDGRVAHPGEARWRDIQRDNVAATTGLTTLRYSWHDVTVTPCRVAAEIAGVLSDRGFTGARPCSADCPVGRRPAETQSPSPIRTGQHAAIRRSSPIRAGRRTTHAGRRVRGARRA